MAQQQQPDLASILAALGHGRSGSTPAQTGTPAPNTYPSAATPSNPLAGLALPQPTNSGNLDLSQIKPVNTGSVSLADAIAKAKGMAAERATARDGRGSYRQSRSRSPQRGNSQRDSYNPFRDERRDGARTGAGGRDRSASPLGAQGSVPFSPPRSSMARTRSPPPKKETDSEVITVDSSSVGLIIGRQGENLKRVEGETGARVQFITGPEAGPQRQCRISGTARQRADAKADIYRIINEHPREQPQKRQESTQPSYEVESIGKNGEQNITMMVPDKTVGLIIGRGGETIRDIQERSGCHVNITGTDKSINGLRPVNLIGSRQTTDEARRLINDVVESDTRQGPPPSATPSHQYSHYPPPHTPYPPQPAYGMPPPYDPYAGQQYEQPKATDTMTVPSEAVGMIIGKGGETIKEMQNMTGVKINVAPPTGPDINRDIGLIGTRPAIESAKRAIWEKVNAVREKQGGVWTRGGEVAAPAPYSDPYAHQPPAYGQYGQPPMHQAHSVPPPAQADPYAIYGGYENYCALWAAAGGGQGPGH